MSLCAAVRSEMMEDMKNTEGLQKKLQSRWKQSQLKANTAKTSLMGHALQSCAELSFRAITCGLPSIQEKAIQEKTKRQKQSPPITSPHAVYL